MGSTLENCMSGSLSFAIDSNASWTGGSSLWRIGTIRLAAVLGTSLLWTLPTTTDRIPPSLCLRALRLAAKEWSRVDDGTLPLITWVLTEANHLIRRLPATTVDDALRPLRWLGRRPSTPPSLLVRSIKRNDDFCIRNFSFVPYVRDWNLANVGGCRRTFQTNSLDSFWWRLSLDAVSLSAADTSPTSSLLFSALLNSADFETFR